MRIFLSRAIVSVAISNHCRRQYSGAGAKGAKIVVIMGATGTGKTKLSVDVATRFGGEIVNSDKIQVYRGLDVTTNKVPAVERRGVPHHLLGSIDPSRGEMGASAFRRAANTAIRSIGTRGKVPVVAGGSNSFIHALVSDRYEPGADMFAPSPGLRYRCCFVWVHVEEETLRDYLDLRVDEMVGSGMAEELEGYFGKSTAELESHVGLRKAIGVPEFEGHFRKYRNADSFSGAVRAIKENTRRLAEEQVTKIRRLGEEAGWALRRVDATRTVQARLQGRAWNDTWQRDVVGPAFRAVGHFLEEDDVEAAAAAEQEEQELNGLTLPLTCASNC